MQKVSAVSMQQGSAANSRGEPSLDNTPSSKQGAVCRNLAFLKQNVKAPWRGKRGQHRRKYLVAPSAKQSDVRTQ